MVEVMELAFVVMLLPEAMVSVPIPLLTADPVRIRLPVVSSKSFRSYVAPR